MGILIPFPQPDYDPVLDREYGVKREPLTTYEQGYIAPEAMELSKYLGLLGEWEIVRCEKKDRSQPSAQ